MLELLIGVLLAAGAIFFILSPIVRPEFAGSGTGEEGRGDEREDPEDDFSRRAVALRLTDAGKRQVPNNPRVGYTHVYGAPGISGVNILSR